LEGGDKNRFVFVTVQDPRLFILFRGKLDARVLQHIGYAEKEEADMMTNFGKRAFEDGRA